MTLTGTCLLLSKVLKNLGMAASEQKTCNTERRQNWTTDFATDVLDEDPLSENPKKCKVVEELDEKPSPDFHIQALQVEHSYSLSCVDDGRKEMLS